MPADPPRSFIRHELGLWLPASQPSEPPKPIVPYVGTYLTYTDLTNEPSLTESAIVAYLQKMSAADCLLALADLSARLFGCSDRGMNGGLQHELVDHVIGDGPLSDVLHERLNDPRWSTIWFEQQLVHMARLVVLHADRRPPDEFCGKTLYAEWVTCLIAVTDLLDANLRVEDHGARLAWEIRQSELNRHAEQLATTALYHELYSVLWPKFFPAGAAAVDQAFESVTQMSISDYFMVGTAVMARLVNFARSNEGGPILAPDSYFSSTSIDPSIPRAFFAFNSRHAAELANQLQAEEAQYGPTTYGSLTFERFPLVEAQPGLFVPISVPSLHRRITQGVFHVLAEAAEEEGRDRRHYVSAFGDVFQQLVENAVRRGEAARPSPAPITADVEYGGRSNRRRSSDIIVAYEQNPVFIEVVSGPLQAATTTRGDVRSFHADLERLIIGKARQLNRCINDFLAGAFAPAAAEPKTTQRIWPLILTSHPFPHAETIMAEVLDALETEGLLTQDKVGELAIVSAEDLVFCEGYMEQGRTLLSLLRRWKSDESARLLPFKNALIKLGGGRAPASGHFERRFAEATASYMNKLLGGSVTPDHVLEQTRPIADAPDQ